MTPPPFLSWGIRSSSADDDYAVRVNALTGGLLMLAIICYLSGRRQTAVIGLTIRETKYTQLVLFCVRFDSVLSQLTRALSKRLWCYVDVAEMPIYLVKKRNVISGKDTNE